jgi:hypothetical protein
MKLYYSYNMDVDCAYIIRVKGHKKSEQLAKRCSDSCDKVGMPWQYWDGYDATGDTIIAPEGESPVMDLIRLSDHYLRKGEVANSLNHARLWAKCVTDDKPMVILEHDAVMVKPYKKHTVFNSVCYLGGFEQAKNGWGVYPTPPHASDGHNFHFILRTHAYAIDPAVAKNLLAHVIKNGIIGPSDMLIRADLFPIHQSGLYAFDEEAESTILNRPQSGRPSVRNEGLKI